MSLLRATDLTFHRGPDVVLAGVSLHVGPGDRLGVVGPNGCGKSTLLQLLAGVLEPTTGDVRVVPADAVIGLVDQELRIERAGETVLERLRRSTGVSDAATALEQAATTYADDDGSAYASALARYEAVGAADFDARLDLVLAELGLAARGDVAVEALSGGEQARVDLATVILHRAEILLLDEPTNDLDASGIDRLEALVTAPGRAIVVVSHDRAFLERTVTAVLEIDDHTRTAVVHHGGWDAYQSSRAAMARHARERHAQYVGERERLTEQIRRERRWADRGTSRVRRSGEPDRNIKSKRLASAEERAGSARRTSDRLERLEVVPKPFEGWELRLTLAEADRGSTDAVVAEQIVVRRGAFGLGPVDLRIRAGDRIALRGANGAGKTTLLRTLLGEIEPDAGSVAVGPSVVFGLLGQTRDRYASSRPLLERFCEVAGTDPQAARSVLAKLGLGAAHVDRPASSLSPGERTRAVLAEFQHRGVNFLVLDEPTNHLDVEAIEQLETALVPYRGTLVVVTHDRRFREAFEVDRELELVDGRLLER